MSDTGSPRRLPEGHGPAEGVTPSREEEDRAVTSDINGETVRVRRQMGDYRRAEYRLESVTGIHWDRISGGVQTSAPQDLLHGYVSCDGMLQGELAHSGTHGPHPHRIKVCILKVDNSPAVFRHFEQQTGPKPPSGPTCAQDALRIVGQLGEVVGPNLRKKLEALGHRRMNISVVLPRMEKRKLLSSIRVGHAKVYRIP